MSALTSQLVCLLIAQVGTGGDFPIDRPSAPPAQPPAVTGDDFPFRQPPVESNQARPDFNQPRPEFNQPRPEFNQPRPEFNQPRPEFNQASQAGQAGAAAAAKFDTPTVPIHSRTTLARVEALVEQFMRWDPDSIEGDPVTLLECVQRTANTGQRAATVKAYWQLCGALGRYSQAEQELVALAGITPQFDFEQSQINAAQRSTEARRAQARVDLLEAQEKLGEVARLADETLALPTDMPFVGKYQTKLTTMYAGRAIPRQLRKVDRALPHQLNLIEQRANAVDANTRLVGDLAALYQQDQVPLSALLGACQELTRERDKFLQAVLHYNYEIATYSQTVVGSAVPADSLVSTLIRQRSATTPRIFRDDNVMPAAARQPALGARAGDRRTASGAASGGRSIGGPAARGALGDVRSAFEPSISRRRIEPRQPAINEPALDPNTPPSTRDFLRR